MGIFTRVDVSDLGGPAPDLWVRGHFYHELDDMQRNLKRSKTQTVLQLLYYSQGLQVQILQKYNKKLVFTNILHEVIVRLLDSTCLHICLPRGKHPLVWRGLFPTTSTTSAEMIIIPIHATSRMLKHSSHLSASAAIENKFNFLQSSILRLPAVQKTLENLEVDTEK